MADADHQRAGGRQAAERSAGEHRLSLAEWLLPVAAALDDQLRAATGFEYTLVLWRHAAMTATIAFLKDLTAGGDGTAVALT
jgi:hypothetical protein